MIVVLAGLPLPIAGAALWLAALGHLAMTKALARMLLDQHREQQRLEAAQDEHAVQLTQREAQIVALEADLARARAVRGGWQEAEADRVYRQVGLHPRAPEFLITAATRAFRAALHPDRHPRHRTEAHSRYLKAETAFERIEELRR